VTLRSSGLDGVVTDVLVRPGETIRTWDEVLAVNGVMRIAAATDRPFHRTLRFGSEGDDVLMLEHLLASSGRIESVPDRVYDRGTVAAIKELERSLGVDRPTGEFDPGLVIWLPAPTVQVDELDVSVLDPAPTLGEVIVEGARPLRRLQLTEPTGDRLAGIEPGSYELVVDGTVLGIVDDPDALGATVRQAFRRLMHQAGADSTPDAYGMDGVIRLIQPRRSTLVPTSSVMTDHTGEQTCIWVKEEGDHRVVPITVEGGSLGATQIAEPLDDEIEILVNPVDVLEAPQCPSSS